MTKKTTQKSFLDATDALALQIATEANMPGVKLVEKVEAMKVLASYAIGMVKMKGKEPQDPDSGPRFGDMQERLRSIK